MLDYSKQEPVIFPYKEWEIKTGNSKEIVKRPIALVGLGTQNIKMSALIDSGSDKTISYLYPFGKILGITANAASVRVNRGLLELRKKTGYEEDLTIE